MSVARPPSRRELLCVITHLQGLVGKARGAYQNDKAPNRSELVQHFLNAAEALCIQVTDFSEPVQPDEEAKALRRLMPARPRKTTS